MAVWYETRDVVLAAMRFASYAEYLASGLWRSIRAKVLKRCRRWCEACHNAPATQVHHRSYCLDAMRGRRLDFLVGCCRGCHEQAEFAAGRKVPPKAANIRMGDIARSAGRTLFGICKGCGKNPTSKRKKLCGLCKRNSVQTTFNLPIPRGIGLATPAAVAIAGSCRNANQARSQPSPASAARRST